MNTTTRTKIVCPSWCVDHDAWSTGDPGVISHDSATYTVRGEGGTVHFQTTRVLNEDGTDVVIGQDGTLVYVTAAGQPAGAYTSDQALGIVRALLPALTPAQLCNVLATVAKQTR